VVRIGHRVDTLVPAQLGSSWTAYRLTIASHTRLTDRTGISARSAVPGIGVGLYTPAVAQRALRTDTGATVAALAAAARSIAATTVEGARLQIHTGVAAQGERAAVDGLAATGLTGEPITTMLATTIAIDTNVSAQDRSARAHDVLANASRALLPGGTRVAAAAAVVAVAVQEAAHVSVALFTQRPTAGRAFILPTTQLSCGACGYTTAATMVAIAIGIDAPVSAANGPFRAREGHAATFFAGQASIAGVATGSAVGVVGGKVSAAAVAQRSGIRAGATCVDACGPRRGAGLIAAATMPLPEVPPVPEAPPMPEVPPVPMGSPGTPESGREPGPPSPQAASPTLKQVAMSQYVLLMDSPDRILFPTRSRIISRRQ
jgi:hypothetical protein